ncbi:MAG: polyribonucleotide nucleotidyltransferase [Puniceicoccales bacterium]|jgi:polyribonucleotide nucleotidyltransferase|nr:polyribonucleotide nucleotidyltransferase [Puniceicoccales bacterium]
MNDYKFSPASVQMHVESIATQGITISTGELAKQANGAITIQMGNTVVLVTAVANRNISADKEYLPLSVEYREKFCAAGRFPGNYTRREGRPAEREILIARLCDRPVRPLFPNGFRNETQLIALLLATDLRNDPDTLVINGASAALCCSDIPWNGPIGCVRIGEISGKWVVNPTNEQLYESTLDLLYVGTERDMLMIEGSADQISEAHFLEALIFAQEQIQPIIAAQKCLTEKIGKGKRHFPLLDMRKDVFEFCEKKFSKNVRAALKLSEKLDRREAIANLRENAEAVAIEKFGADLEPHQITVIFDELEKQIYRKGILAGECRSDDRKADEIRPIRSATGFLPCVHGNSLFQRGETQALVSVTLGSGGDTQSLDGISGGISEKSFILHYNFPPFSVGETGRFGAPGRREIGHGALAERSLLPVIPDKDAFPYSIRVVSEILESNGSSSMATVCGGTLALMDAGVPLLAPVAGISIGLMSESDIDGQIVRYRLLTDITGAEDHYGEMDFKIAGTAAGITGFQLDLKIPGLPFAIAKEAVQRSASARAEIIATMGTTLETHRAELRPCAPRWQQFSISSGKIGALIGPGGKNIKRITEATGARIDVKEDNSGQIMIFAPSVEALSATIREIEFSCGEIEPGKVYCGIVRSVKDFGAFVECFPGQEGLVHVSEFANVHIGNMDDVCRVGDQIIVKCVGLDAKGRIRLSRKAVSQTTGTDQA